MRIKHLFSFAPLALLFLLFTSMAPLPIQEGGGAGCFCTTTHEFQTVQLNGCRVGMGIDLSPTPSLTGATAACFIDEVRWFSNGGATVVTIPGSNFVVLEAPGPGTYEVCVEVTVVGLDGQCTEYFCTDVRVEC